MLKAVIQFIDHSDSVESGIGKFIDRAVSKSILVMERNVKNNTPVHHGYLRRSIASKKTGFGQGEVFTNPIGNVTEATSKKKGIARTKPVSYAVFVEYGTRHMAPRAMFRKGVADSEKQIQDIFKQEAKTVHDSAKGVK